MLFSGAVLFFRISQRAGRAETFPGALCAPPSSVQSAKRADSFPGTLCALRHKLGAARVLVNPRAVRSRDPCYRSAVRSFILFQERDALPHLE
jgi:hypothetical protein